VRALFSRIPLLVEGPGDRAVVETFWRALADQKAVLPAEQLGLDVVNCEGAPEMPAMARLLAEAGKRVVVWAEQDRPTSSRRSAPEATARASFSTTPPKGGGTWKRRSPRRLPWTRSRAG
jgi:predicted ATP-dependent endonuclease of OLD family